ncbi:MAG: prepilin peptidase [Candidatus Eisenbacteria bacterium]|nr:prepilin peptidase [Candidatus Eisenbacteria bacterium]
MSPKPLAIALSLGLVLAAAYFDIRARRIPNSLTYPSALLALGLGAAGGAHALLLAAGGLLVGFGLLLPAYLIKAMGAGDLKLLAALGGFLGPRAILDVFLHSLIAGGLIALMFLALRGELRKGIVSLARLVAGLAGRRFGFPARSDSEESRWVSIGKIPYGVAIAIGTVSALIPALT